MGEARCTEEPYGESVERCELKFLVFVGARRDGEELREELDKTVHTTGF